MHWRLIEYFSYSQQTPKKQESTDLGALETEDQGNQGNVLFLFDLFIYLFTYFFSIKCMAV